MPILRVAMYIACAVLLLLALAFSFLALLATGGDSYFSDKSGWIYTPWLVALALTMAAVIATATGQVVAGTTLIVSAGIAYAATWFVWDLFSD